MPVSSYLHLGHQAVKRQCSARALLPVMQGGTILVLRWWAHGPGHVALIGGYAAMFQDDLEVPPAYSTISHFS